MVSSSTVSPLGLVIGPTIHHQVADGQSLSSFLLAWSKLVRGLDAGPFPCHDRAAILVPRNPPRCHFNHWAVEFGEISTSKSPTSLENLAVRFSADFITKLKTHVTVGDLGHRSGTFECILVHLWKKITLARGLQEDEVTHVRVAVNGRARMMPAVPAEYFGNLVLWAYTKLRVGDLLNGRHAFVAKSIHDAVARMDDAYFKSFIDFGELSKARGGETKTISAKPEAGSSLSPDFEVDSWLSFQFHELDFGTGGPCDVIPPYLPLDGLLILVPSCMWTPSCLLRLSMWIISNRFASLWTRLGSALLPNCDSCQASRMVRFALKIFFSGKPMSYLLEINQDDCY